MSHEAKPKLPKPKPRQEWNAKLVQRFPIYAALYAIELSKNRYNLAKNGALKPRLSWSIGCHSNEGKIDLKTISLLTAKYTLPNLDVVLPPSCNNSALKQVKFFFWK